MISILEAQIVQNEAVLQMTPCTHFIVELRDMGNDAQDNAKHTGELETLKTKCTAMQKQRDILEKKLGRIEVDLGSTRTAEEGALQKVQAAEQQLAAAENEMAKMASKLELVDAENETACITLAKRAIHAERQVEGLQTEVSGMQT